MKFKNLNIILYLFRKVLTFSLKKGNKWIISTHILPNYIQLFSY